MGYIGDTAYLGEDDIWLLRTAMKRFTAEVELLPNWQRRADRLIDILYRTTTDMSVHIESSDFEYDLESPDDDD